MEYIVLTEEQISQIEEGVYDPSIFKVVFLAGGPGCFHPDTLVWTEDGYTKISELKIGDKVYSLDSEKKISIAPIDNVFRNEVSNLVDIELENGEIITCSNDHQIRLRTGEWIEAMYLQENDELWSETDPGPPESK